MSQAFEFNLGQLAEVGCHVTIEVDGLRKAAHVVLPDGSTVESITDGKGFVLCPWHRPSRDAINRLVAIGGEPTEIEDIPF